MLGRCCAAIAALVAGLTAQAVWTVPSGVPLDATIALASPGDIVLLADSHPTFVLNKGLQILGLGVPTATSPGTVIAGPSPVYVNLPPGERAALVGFSLQAWSQTMPNWGLQVLAGRVAVADVDCSTGVRVDGEVVCERVRFAAGGLLLNGLCVATEAAFHGRATSTTGIGFTAPTPGIDLVGAGATFVGSHLTVTGGAGGGFAVPSAAGAPGLRAGGGRAFVSDATIVGGAAGPTTPGGVALAGNGNVSIVRTTLVEGVGAPGVSGGYAVDDTMLGMQCSGAPTRGAAFTVTATAGSSQDVLGLLGGFDRTPNLFPVVPEPLFGAPAQWVGLLLALPAPGAAVSFTVSVPNVAALRGSEVWLQAVQRAGPILHASTLVGGPVR